jgi:hypothetical protein
MEFEGKVETVGCGGVEADAVVEALGGVAGADGEADGDCGGAGLSAELGEDFRGDAVSAEALRNGDVDEVDEGGGAVEKDAAGEGFHGVASGECCVVSEADDGVFGVGKLCGVAGELGVVLEVDELLEGGRGEVERGELGGADFAEKRGEEGGVSGRGGAKVDGHGLRL